MHGACTTGHTHSVDHDNTPPSYSGTRTWSQQTMPDDTLNTITSIISMKAAVSVYHGNLQHCIMILMDFNNKLLAFTVHMYCAAHTM